MVAIKANNNNGKQILKYLKKLGGVNSYNISSDCRLYYYYINDQNIICYGKINFIKQNYPNIKFLETVPKEDKYSLW